MDITINNLYSLEHTIAADYLKGFTYPWEALEGISELIMKLGESLSADEFDHPCEDVWIAKDAHVFDSAYVHGPCIIGHNTEVRQCAFIRGSALVGDNCVIGNSTELKNVILFNNCEVPHFNYVGDSILGFKAHLGAGAVTSNVKADRLNIVIKNDGEELITGRRKIGAMLGDHVEVGCNCVLNPGTIVGRNTNIYPLSSVRGCVPADSIYKNAECIIIKENR